MARGTRHVEVPVAAKTERERERQRERQRERDRESGRYARRARPPEAGRCLKARAISQRRRQSSDSLPSEHDRVGGRRPDRVQYPHLHLPPRAPVHSGYAIAIAARDDGGGSDSTEKRSGAAAGGDGAAAGRAPIAARPRCRPLSIPR